MLEFKLQQQLIGTLLHDTTYKPEVLQDNRYNTTLDAALCLPLDLRHRVHVRSENDCSLTELPDYHICEEIWLRCANLTVPEKRLSFCGS